MQVYLLLDIALMHPEAEIGGARHFSTLKNENKKKCLNIKKACKDTFVAYLMRF